MNDLTLYKDFETHDKGFDEGKNMMQNGILVIAYHLKAIKENKLYLALKDESVKTWASYCSSKKIEQSKADKYIELYNFYVLEMNKRPDEIVAMSIDTLSRCKPMLNAMNPESREEWFAKMQTLSRSDLIKELEKEKFAKPSVVQLKVCEKCEKKQIFYNQDLICNCKGFHAIYAKPIEK